MKLSFLRRSFAHTRRKLAPTRRNFVATRRNFGATGKKLSATGRNVAPTRRNLAATGRKLGATRRNVAATRENSGFTRKNLARAGKSVVVTSRKTAETGEESSSTGTGNRHAHGFEEHGDRSQMTTGGLSRARRRTFCTSCRDRRSGSVEPASVARSLQTFTRDHWTTSFQKEPSGRRGCVARRQTLPRRTVALRHIARGETCEGRSPRSLESVVAVRCLACTPREAGARPGDLEGPERVGGEEISIVYFVRMCKGKVPVQTQK